MRELEAARFGSLFASPLLEHMWADGAELNVELRERVLEHARRHPGSEQTNVGGWHSEIGRLEFCGSAGERLVRHMREMTEEATLRLYASYSRPPEPLSWILSAWANINRRGDFNNMHTHPGATWSGVYYVDDGESSPDAEGTAIAAFRSLPGAHQYLLPRAFELECPVQAGAWFDDPVSELRAACRPAASGRPAADFDRLQRAEGAVSVTMLEIPVPCVTVAPIGAK